LATEAAAKPYAQRLPRRLRQGWGASKAYTQGQIDAAVRDLRLNPKYVFIAYAAFLAPKDPASAQATFEGVTILEAQAAFDRWRPISSNWSSNDAADGSYSTADNYDGGGHHSGHH
jgi:hypothetical protein